MRRTLHLMVFLAMLLAASLPAGVRGMRILTAGSLAL